MTLAERKAAIKEHDDKYNVYRRRVKKRAGKSGRWAGWKPQKVQRTSEYIAENFVIELDPPSNPDDVIKRANKRNHHSKETIKRRWENIFTGNREKIRDCGDIPNWIMIPEKKSKKKYNYRKGTIQTWKHRRKNLERYYEKRTVQTRVVRGRHNPAAPLEMPNDVLAREKSRRNKDKTTIARRWKLIFTGKRKNIRSRGDIPNWINITSTSK